MISEAVRDAERALTGLDFESRLLEHAGQYISLWLDTQYAWVGRLSFEGPDTISLRRNLGACPDQIKATETSRIYIRTSAIVAFKVDR